MADCYLKRLKKIDWLYLKYILLEIHTWFSKDCLINIWAAQKLVNVGVLLENWTPISPCLLLGGAFIYVHSLAFDVCELLSERCLLLGYLVCGDPVGCSVDEHDHRQKRST